MSTSRLLGLPAELRNTIYELTFTPDSTSCDVNDAKPPSSALLRACRQINSEAGGLYAESCRHYWSTTLFTSKDLRLEDHPAREARKTHPSLLQHHGVLSLIRHLEVTVNTKLSITKLRLELSDTRRVWKINERTTGRKDAVVSRREYYFVIIPASAQNPVKWSTYLFDRADDGVEFCVGIEDGATMEAKVLDVVRDFGFV